jgi:hypothetical protein
MAARRFVAVAVPFALVGLLAIGPAPVRAQDKKDKKTGLDEATIALMTAIEEAVKARDYRKNPKHGDGRTPYEEVPSKPGLIAGFDLYPGIKDKTTQYLRGVKPIWLQNDGHKYLGKTVGWVGSGTGAVRVEAKPGYAVAGLKLHTEFGEIAGLAVVFAKITATGLDMADSYDSKYYGHKDPNTAKKVVCTGEPIVGIHGLVADHAKSHDFGLGLIVLGKEEGKKK